MEGLDINTKLRSFRTTDKEVVSADKLDAMIEWQEACVSESGSHNSPEADILELLKGLRDSKIAPEVQLSEDAKLELNQTMWMTGMGCGIPQNFYLYALAGYLGVPVEAVVERILEVENGRSKK